MSEEIFKMVIKSISLIPFIYHGKMQSESETTYFWPDVDFSLYATADFITVLSTRTNQKGPDIQYVFSAI
jgi:hypothetical protein